MLQIYIPEIPFSSFNRVACYP